MTLINSLTFRTIATAFLVVLLFTSGILWLQRDRTITALEDRRAETLSSDLIGLRTLYDQRRIVALRQAIEFRAAADSDQILYLSDRNGTRLAGNIDEPPTGVTFPDGTLETLTPTQITFPPNAIEYDTIATTLPGGFQLLVGHDRTPITAEILRQTRTLWIALVLLLAFSALVCWWVTRALFRQLSDINTVATQISGGARDTRFGAPYASHEFGHLKSNLDAMLDRIIALIRAHQDLSDTVAHELRTPLNRINQKLENITGQEDTVADLRTELHNTVRVFDSLLSISSAEAKRGDTSGFSVINLSDLITEIADLYVPVAEDRDMTLIIQTADTALILGDKTLIAQMVINLVENALKFCANGDKITLSVTANDHTSTITVSDTGPGLPKDIEHTALQSFVRGRNSEQNGHGLGLSLVRAIALRHGAKLELPTTDIGLTIRIEFKAAMGHANLRGST